MLLPFLAAATGVIDDTRTGVPPIAGDAATAADVDARLLDEYERRSDDVTMGDARRSSCCAAGDRPNMRFPADEWGDGVARWYPNRDDGDGDGVA